MANSVGEKKSKNILLGIIILLTIVLIITIVSGLMLLKVKAENNKMLNSPNIYNNIFIQGVNVSNMSKEEAKKQVDNITLDEKITLTYGDKQYILNRRIWGYIK